MNSSIVDFICQRTSSPRLSEPSPPPELMDKVFQSAFRAPDHMLLRPWRYLTIEGDAREQLGEVFVEAARLSDEKLSEFRVDKLRSMPLRAPLLVVAIASPDSNPKVPLIEQILSCGVGVGYMLLSLQALGYGGIWRTGEMAEDPYVQRQLGLSDTETIVGFLYVGTPVGDTKALTPLSTADYVKPWTYPTGPA